MQRENSSKVLNINKHQIIILICTINGRFAYHYVCNENYHSRHKLLQQ